jgi:hypothetical protein
LDFVADAVNIDYHCADKLFGYFATDKCNHVPILTHML